MSPDTSAAFLIYVAVIAVIVVGGILAALVKLLT
jgi:hypothetical protein